MKVFSSSQLLDLQRKQHTEILVLSDSVPGNSIKLGKRAITNSGHFLLKSITGKFQTPIDNPECFLMGQMSDSSGNRTLFSDHVPLDLILSPGSIGNRFLQPFEFEYTFASNSDILFEVKNTFTDTLKYTICFKGIRLS